MAGCIACAVSADTCWASDEACKLADSYDVRAPESSERALSAEARSEETLPAEVSSSRAETAASPKRCETCSRWSLSEVSSVTAASSCDLSSERRSAASPSAISSATCATLAVAASICASIWASCCLMPSASPDPSAASLSRTQASSEASTDSAETSSFAPSTAERTRPAASSS